MLVASHQEGHAGKEETGHCRVACLIQGTKDGSRSSRSSRSIKGGGGASNLGIQVVLERQRERPTPNPRAPPPAQLPSSHLALYESQYT